MKARDITACIGSLTHEKQRCVLLDLPTYLAKAGQSDRLAKILTNFDFVQIKLKLFGTKKLIDDYEHTEVHFLKMIKDAIKLSTHILDQDSNQLITQLYGRLTWKHINFINMFLNEACKSQDRAWLRPTTSSFDQAGSPLIRTIEGKFRWGHALAVTSDCKRIVLSSDDWGIFLDYQGWDILPPPPDDTLKPTLTVWDIESGKELSEFRGHFKRVKDIAILPGDKRVVSLSGDGILKVWDIDTGEELLTRKEEGAIQAVHQTVGCILSLSVDRRILKVWDIGTGKDYRLYSVEEGPIAHHPDGKRVVSLSGDGILKVWDIDTGEELLELEGKSLRVDAINFTDNGNKVIAHQKPNIFRLWNINDGRLLFTRRWDSLSPVATVKLTTRAKIIAFDFKTISIRDLLSWDESRILGMHNDWILQIALTSDCKSAISLSKDQILKVWNLESWEEIPRKCNGRLDSIYSIAITPDGNRVISGTNAMSINVNDIRTGEELFKFDGSKDVCISALAVCPDNIRVIFGVRYDEDSPYGIVPYKTLNVLDLEKNKIVQTIKGHRADINAVAVTPDGHRAVSSSLWDLMVWDLNIGMATLIYSKHEDIVSSIAIASDAIRVVSGSHDKNLRVWDIDTGEDIFVLTGHQNAVRSVAIHPGGKQVISASDDTTLKIWDLEHGLEIGTLEGHEAEVNAVSIAPHGRWAVSASTDKSLMIWDLTSRKMITRCILDCVLRSVAVSPDSEMIVAGGNSGKIYILKLEEPIKYSSEIIQDKKNPHESSSCLEINQRKLHEHYDVCQVIKFDLPVIYPRDVM